MDDGDSSPTRDEGEALKRSDAFQPSPPLQATEEDVARWNQEWLRYLGKEWQVQLAHFSAYPDCPSLPDEPHDLIPVRLGWGPPLGLYCSRRDLASRRVMEMGCGAGNLGKLLGRYATAYLGTDYSTLALAVARLVSPSNCTYLHVTDGNALASFLGTIDTVVSRHFWIHQNFELARWNLEFLVPFLIDRGRLYVDLYWPDPARPQGKVLLPEDQLSRAYPSATFKYTRSDVERLIAPHPLRIVSEEVVVEMQRRYVVLEKVEIESGSSESAPG